MMKRLLSLLIIAFCGFSSPSFSQCVPDVNITQPGIYPDSATGLPSGVAGLPYSEVIQAKVLTDTTFQGLPVVITNITVIGVTGLPPGITYSCNPSSCVFPGGSNGCILLSGTPSTAGLFPLNVNLEIAGTVFGIPATPVAQTLDYYSIFIDVNSGVNSDLSSVKFNLLPNNPNPASTYTDISFTSPSGGDFVLKIYNVIGKEVYHQMFRGRAGLNSTRVETSGFSSGVYLISLENGTNLVTRRMIVSKK